MQEACRIVARLRRAGRLALLLAATAATAAPGARAQCARFEAVAPDVFVMCGALGEPSPENCGAVSNIGLLVGPHGALVIGTGTSDAHARRVLEAARAAAQMPVRAALNLQATPDHVLGNAVFEREGIPVLAHEDTVLFMRANCSRCLRTLAEQAGAASVAGTRSAEPLGRLQGGERLALIGRPVELLHLGPAFQTGSLAVLDRERRVLFAGELLSIGRIPDLRNADVDGWLAALEHIARLPATLVVPAHGPPVAPGRARELADYLRQLRAAVQRAYAAGLSISEATRQVDLPAFHHWALYATQHPRNVYFTYLEVEEEEFAR